MKTISEYLDVPIPEWSLPYIVNGDDSGLTKNEKRQVDEYMKAWDDEAARAGGRVLFGVGDGEPYFTRYTEFGPAGNAVDCVIKIVRD